MHGHLIAVKVGVVTGADQRMDLDGVAFNKHRLKRLDTHAMESWRAVEKHRMILDDLFKHVPHFWVAPIKHALGALDGVGKSAILELANDERLEQFQRDLLWQTALMQFQFWTNNDDGTRRIINALAEQILAESALLALDHVGERLERTIA